MKRPTIRVAGIVTLCCSAPLSAQHTSLYLKAQERRVAEPVASPGLPVAIAGGERRYPLPLNRALEEHSLFAVRTKPPHEFKLHDLVTVIVREQKTYQSDSKLESETDFQVRTDISEFFKVINGHLGAATFGDGRPNIDFNLQRELEGEGRTNRSDRLTFRITAEIVDIKPNGLLVLGASQRIQNDEEVQMMKFTGTCRSQDVTADNTILSTQIFDQHILVTHSGAVRDAAKRGWLTKLIDFMSPL